MYARRDTGPAALQRMPPGRTNNKNPSEHTGCAYGDKHVMGYFLVWCFQNFQISLISWILLSKRLVTSIYFNYKQAHIKATKCFPQYILSYKSL